MWSLTNIGMHAWFAAAADTRYSVVVPIIGVQVHLYKVSKRITNSKRKFLLEAH